jgi:hypothetical protein
MAHLEKAPSGRWKVRYRTPTGESRSRTFARKVDAKSFGNTVESSKAAGLYADPVLGRRLFSDYAAAWLKTKADLRPRTLVNLDGRLRNHLVPYFGERPIARIRPEHVRAWAASLTVEKNLAPATTKGAYLALAQIMATAEIDGVIPRTTIPSASSRESIGTRTLLIVVGAGLLDDRKHDHYRSTEQTFDARLRTPAEAGRSVSTRGPADAFC